MKKQKKKNRLKHRTSHIAWGNCKAWQLGIATEADQLAWKRAW